MTLLHLLQYPLRIAHVVVLIGTITVVGHEADGVLPGTRHLIVAVAQYLVDQHLRLFGGATRQAAHGHVGLVLAQQVAAFAVVE